MLKSDYFRIEISSLIPLCFDCFPLKSDYFRIEIYGGFLQDIPGVMLKSDYFRIEILLALYVTLSFP